jgi:hypothetical protein
MGLWCDEWAGVAAAGEAQTEGQGRGWMGDGREKDTGEMGVVV